jgi:glycine oxidase
MTQETDVLIIGGGVIGCSAAYFLRKQGRDVTVIDRDEIGKGATWAATGLLSPIRPFLRPDHAYMRFQLAGMQCFSSLVPELEEESKIALEYMLTGTLRVIHQPEERLHAWVSEWQRAGFCIELLDGEALRQREPILATDVVAAIYNPQEPQINAQQLFRAYATAALYRGTRFLSHTPATGLLYQGNRVTAVRTVDGDIHCHYLIVAAGAWSAFCSTWLHTPIPVRPFRGQSLLLLPDFPLHHILFYDHIYLAPKRDGIIVGATREDVGFDTSTTAEGITSLLDAVRKVAPSLAKSRVERTWAGLRPRTPDTRPIIGKVPGWQNVILASGHGGFGILLSGVTGQSVADLIVTGHLPAIVQPFALERFSP